MNEQEIIDAWNKLTFHERIHLSVKARIELDKDYVEPNEVYNVTKFQLK